MGKNTFAPIAIINSQKKTNVQFAGHIGVKEYLNMAYQLQKKDVSQAGLVLADAFHNDVVWKLFLKPEAPLEQKAYSFESPVKFCLKYGGVCASSESIEGVAAWVPGNLADMTFWRLLKCGAIISGLRSIRATSKIAMKQGQIFKPLMEARRTSMKDKDYLYLMILGVKPVFQGQGFGTRLVKRLIKKSEKENRPIYLETETEYNIGFYEHLGFKQIDKVMLPIINLPQWTMIRDPE